MVALLVAGLLPYGDAQIGGEPAGPSMRPIGPLYGPVEVLAVRDGDTLVVDSNVGPRTVRLIGIDAPEVAVGEALGAEATRRLEELLPIDAVVWLELDLGLEDIYGRLLAYVYVADPNGQWAIDGHGASQVNLSMMRSGWARTLSIPPNVTYADLYDDAAAAARDAGLGVWALPEAAASVRSSHQAPVEPEDALAAPDTAIALHCALVNPDTPNDTAGEWVSVKLSAALDTRGYHLFDEGSKQVFRLPVGEQPAGEIRIDNPGQGVWNNGGDTIYLKRGVVTIDSWTYSGREVVQGRVMCRGDDRDRWDD